MAKYLPIIKVPYNNVWAITMFFLLYNIYIDQSESVWYVVEQYGEKSDWNIGMHIGCGSPAVMHS